MAAVGCCRFFFFFFARGGGSLFGFCVAESVECVVSSDGGGGRETCDMSRAAEMLRGAVPWRAAAMHCWNGSFRIGER